MPLFRVCVCEVSLWYMLGGEVWWLVGEICSIGTSRNFVSGCLPPCSFRMSDALCIVGVNWVVHN